MYNYKGKISFYDVVDATSARRHVKLGKIYKHFKHGDLYMPLHVALHHEGVEQWVVYMQLKSQQIFIRPLEEFLSEVDKNKYPDAAQRYRMQLLNDNSAASKDEGKFDITLREFKKPTLEDFLFATGGGYCGCDCPDCEQRRKERGEPTMSEQRQSFWSEAEKNKMQKAQGCITGTKKEKEPDTCAYCGQEYSSTHQEAQ